MTTLPRGPSSGRRLELALALLSDSSSQVSRPVFQEQRRSDPTTEVARSCAVPSRRFRFTSLYQPSALDLGLLPCRPLPARCRSAHPFDLRVLIRDGVRCVRSRLRARTPDPPLGFRSSCRRCHDRLHLLEFEIRLRRSLPEPVVGHSSPDRARPRKPPQALADLPALSSPPGSPLDSRSKHVGSRVIPEEIQDLRDDAPRPELMAAFSAATPTLVVAGCSVRCPLVTPTSILLFTSFSDVPVAAFAAIGDSGSTGLEDYGRFRHSWDPVRCFPGQARFFISFHPPRRSSCWSRPRSEPLFRFHLPPPKR